MPTATTTPNSSLRPLIIIGAGGHAVSVANVAISAGYQIKYFVDPDRQGSDLLDIRIIAGLSEINDVPDHSFTIAIGDNASRERIHQELITQHGSLHFPALIHRSAIISAYTHVGDGTLVMPGAVVGPNSRIGKFCILNTRASIDHDSAMDNFSSLAPGATTGGKVRIGKRSAISIGAVVKHAVSIGDDCVLGANSYLHENLANNSVAYGTPAKVVRTRKIGDAYL